jgi:hypothetical protein
VQDGAPALAALRALYRVAGGRHALVHRDGDHQVFGANAGEDDSCRLALVKERCEGRRDAGDNAGQPRQVRAGQQLRQAAVLQLHVKHEVEQPDHAVRPVPQLSGVPLDARGVVLEDRGGEFFAGGEVAVDGGAAHPGHPRDLLERDVLAALGE